MCLKREHVFFLLLLSKTNTIAGRRAHVRVRLRHCTIILVAKHRTQIQKNNIDKLKDKFEYLAACCLCLAREYRHWNTCMYALNIQMVQWRGAVKRRRIPFVISYWNNTHSHTATTTAA